nr:unnamed protein product [Digitaria exilis]
MGFDVGEDNIVTASLEDLTVEDHERFMALQKHIEAEFLKTFRKGREDPGQTASTAGQTATGGQTVATGGQTASSGGQTNSTNAMVFVPEQPLPLSTVPNSVSAGRAAESTKGKNVVIGEERPSSKESVREVTYEKTADGKESFKVTVKSSGQGGKGRSLLLNCGHLGLVFYGGQTGCARRSDRLLPVAGSQTARQGQLPRAPLKQVYQNKKKKEVQSMDKRKLQRLRFREKQEQELEKQREILQPSQTHDSIKEGVEAEGRPTGVQTACHPKLAAQAVRPPVQAVRPGDAEAPDVSSSSSSARDGKSTSVPTAEDDEELVDYSSSPERMNLDVNVFHMSMNGDMLSEEEHRSRIITNGTLCA